MEERPTPTHLLSPPLPLPPPPPPSPVAACTDGGSSSTISSALNSPIQSFSPESYLSPAPSPSSSTRARHNIYDRCRRRGAMPTPVSIARQCLSGEAAAALDEAVAIARRRSHAQTSSLHVVSALLSLPSSSSSSSLLRDALSRAPSAAYSPRLQFKALDLCFSLALDRLPSSPSKSGEPPVSNSLMAAIKRSQANQRRHPDTFHLHHQQYNSSSVGVKVELQQLVLSILDDPVVSRVFGEAGFRSYDIKFAILRPPPSALRFPRPGGRSLPLFLCNFSLGAADELDPTSRGFPFPLSTRPLCSDGADENCRRVAEVLLRNRGRNPILVGVGAGDAARDFERAVASQRWSSFPPEARGVELLSIEKEVSEFVGASQGRPCLDSRLGEVGLWLAADDGRSSPGLVLCLGDLKRLVDVVGEEDKSGDGLGRVSYVVSELTRVLEAHPARLWLMGSAANYETYTIFLSLFPSVDKDWDLHLLPITSLKPAGGLLPRPSSLMKSFVPFGGFFPISSDSVAPLSGQYHSPVPCHLCSDKYDQEVAALLKELSVPPEVEYQFSLPPCQQQTEMTSINSGLDMEKAKYDGTVLNAKIPALQKKWNDICRCQHQGHQILETDVRLGSETFSHVNCLRQDADMENFGNQTDRIVDGSKDENTQGNMFPVEVNLHKISSASQSMSMSMISGVKNENLFSKLHVRPSEIEQLQASGLQSDSHGPSLLGASEGHTSCSSKASVSTDLMLGTVHTSINKAEKAMLNLHTEPFNGSGGHQVSKDIDVASGNVPADPIQYSSRVAYSDSTGANSYLPVKTASHLNVAGGSASASNQHNLCSSDVYELFDMRDLKNFCRSLAEKVSWQEDAIRAISQTILHCKADKGRLNCGRVKGDIWLCFLGPDRVGKRKIALALAELLFGSREKLICVDLNLQDGPMHLNTICNNLGSNGYELNLRGKTVLDYLAGEISKKPWSVVLLENIDNADLLVQGNLFQAIKTGRFSDSHRREVDIKNTIFVMTAKAVKGKTNLSSRARINFYEERILEAQAWQLKLVDSTSDMAPSISWINVPGASSKESKCLSVFVHKRKLNMAEDWDGQDESMGTEKRANKTSNTFLDLNLPVEMEGNETDYSNDEGNCVAENTEEDWMEEFLDAVDGTVIFKAFDFDALADDILKEINRNLQDAIASKCVLEIDPKVMEEILAATWLSEGKAGINNWIQQVLVKGIIQAREVNNLPSRRVLRLVACEDANVEDYALGIRLPSRILLH